MGRRRAARQRSALARPLKCQSSLIWRDARKCKDHIELNPNAIDEPAVHASLELLRAHELAATCRTVWAVSVARNSVDRRTAVHEPSRLTITDRQTSQPIHRVSSSRRGSTDRTSNAPIIDPRQTARAEACAGACRMRGTVWAAHEPGQTTRGPWCAGAGEIASRRARSSRPRRICRLSKSPAARK